MADFNETFASFLGAWNQHQSLKASGADFAVLIDSRVRVDALRLDVARCLH